MIAFGVFSLVTMCGISIILLVDRLYTKYSTTINIIRDYFDILDKEEIVNNILKCADTTGYNDEDDFIDAMIFRLIDVIHLKMINENFNITYTQVEIVVFEKLNDYENYFIEDEFMKFFYKDKK